MYKNQYFLEGHNMKVAVAAAAAELATNAGARISMKECDRVAILVKVGAGAGADVKILLQQHIGDAGASKALEIQNYTFVKAGAATKFTKTEPTVAASTIELTDLDGASGLAVIEVLASDLDVNGGYTHISASVGATGSATKLVGVDYITQVNRQTPTYSQDI